MVVRVSRLVCLELAERVAVAQPAELSLNFLVIEVRRALLVFGKLEVVRVALLASAAELEHFDATGDG